MVPISKSLRSKTIGSPSFRYLGILKWVYFFFTPLISRNLHTNQVLYLKSCEIDVHNEVIK